MISYAWLVPFLPLAGALLTACLGRRLKQQAHWPVVAGIALACVVSLVLLAQGKQPATTVVYEWISAGDLRVPVELRVDGLTTMMLAMVTFVATLVTVFAVGYMAGDPGYPRFFAVVGLFVFSMTGLVLSSNFGLTYAFWEGVGVCSYLLIGFWYAKPSAAAAAKKAFLVNRVGDFGFAVALFWMFKTFGTLSYDQVLDPDRYAPGSGVLVSESVRMGIALLLFWAATAKSAQIPLYVWLPDAMEGPTPVSALIHAATMVTAGVYLIARSSVLVFSVPSVAVLICVTGCATALLAAAIALTQTDLKRVLAYSTVSQLGFMFMGLGAGVGSVMQLAVVSAMFHLFTHAFFKALLFLGSGSVMHAMGGVIDMRRFGGLRHRMPITCWTFAIGGLALAGVFPLAGFFSKDEILAAIRMASGASGRWSWVYSTVYWVAVATAFMTAFYTGRAFLLTFFGPEKLPSPDDPEAEPDEGHGHGSASDHGHGHGQGDGHDAHFGHEAPPVMWVPLVVLAACAVLAGMVFGPWTEWFAHHLESTPGFETLGHPEHAHGTDWFSVAVGSVAGIAGLVLSWLLYGTRSAIPGRIAQSVAPLYRASLGKFWVDELYEAVVVKPLNVLAAVSKFFDVYVIDNLVRLASWLPRFVGKDVLAPIQNGLVQFYAAVTALSVALLLIILMLMS